MHLVLTSMRPSPLSRGAKYRVDNGTLKILPPLMNQTVKLFTRRDSALHLHLVELYVISQSAELEDDDMVALQKVRVT